MLLLPYMSFAVFPSILWKHNFVSKSPLQSMTSHMQVLAFISSPSTFAFFGAGLIISLVLNLIYLFSAFKNYRLIYCFTWGWNSLSNSILSLATNTDELLPSLSYLILYSPWWNVSGLTQNSDLWIHYWCFKIKLTFRKNLSLASTLAVNGTLYENPLSKRSTQFAF